MKKTFKILGLLSLIFCAEFGFSEAIRYGDLVAFSSFQGRWLSAQPNLTMECNRFAIGPWEVYRLVDPNNVTSTDEIDLDSSAVALQTVHGSYVVGTPNQQLASTWSLTTENIFFLASADGQVGTVNNGSFIGVLNGLLAAYVSIQENFSIEVNRIALQDWERFTIVKADYYEGEFANEELAKVSID